MKGFVASHLKDMNRRTVYELLAATGEMSRAEISRQTGISSPTVIKIISFFLENGLVYEAGAEDTALGRKPTIIRFNPEAAFSIGVEFEGDFLNIGVVDLIGNILDFKQVRVNPDFDEIVNNVLCEHIESLFNETNIPREKVLGIGLGVPGVVDPQNAIVKFAPLVGIMREKDCKKQLQSLTEKTGLPVFIENDVNAAVIGEFVTRKLPSDSDLIYISLGTGLGAGIVLNGELRRGKHYTAGEIGYIVFDKDFHTSKTKEGWLEGQINFEALSHKWDAFKSALEEKGFEHWKNIPELSEMIEHVASYLALCIANISTIIDTDLVVLGGISTASFGEPLIDAIGRYLEKLALMDVKCQLPYCKQPGVVGTATIVTEGRLEYLLEGGCNG